MLVSFKTIPYSKGIKYAHTNTISNSCVNFKATMTFDEISKTIQSGNTDELKKIRDLSLINSEFKSLLHVSVKENQTEISKYLVEKGLSINSKDKKGKTPFAMACSSQNEELLKFFLGYKPNIDVQDFNGNTPLHKSLQNLNIVGLLLDNGASPYIKNEFGLPVLHCAKENIETVAFLLKRGVNPNSIDDKDQTLLHKASLGGNIELIKKLAEYKAEINFKDLEGKTPLFYTKNIETTKELIKHGANPDAKDKNGESVLLKSVKENNLKNAEELLKSGANPNIKDVNEKTPLYYSENNDAAALLLENGADPNNDFYLHYALISQNDKLIDLLLMHNVAVDKKAENGRTPLFYCSKSEDLEKILNKNPLINIQDNNGNTALHNYLLIGRKDLADILESAGANKTVKNNNNESPYDFYEKWKKYNSWIK